MTLSALVSGSSSAVNFRQQSFAKIRTVSPLLIIGRKITTVISLILPILY